MGTKNEGNDKAVREAASIMIKGNKILIKDIASVVIMFGMLMFYSLTFFVPKFYGRTEDYAGVIVFCFLGLLTLVNVNPFKKLKEKDVDFIVLGILAVVVLVNIILVDSGYGCFFVAVNFALIWYLSGAIKFKHWQIYLFSGLYVVMLLLVLILWFIGLL